MGDERCISVCERDGGIFEIVEKMGVSVCREWVVPEVGCKGRSAAGNGFKVGWGGVPSELKSCGDKKVGFEVEGEGCCNVGMIFGMTKGGGDVVVH